MDLRVVYTRDDGGVSVLIPAPHARQRGESDDEFVRRIAVKDIPPNTAYEIIHKDDLPSRRFRAAWSIAGDTVAVDPVKARAQILEEVRAERGNKLDESDKEKAKLDEVGTDEQRQALREYRQSLRDLPASVTANIAELSVAELEQFQVTWPAKATVK